MIRKYVFPLLLIVSLTLGVAGFVRAQDKPRPPGEDVSNERSECVQAGDCETRREPVVEPPVAPVPQPAQEAPSVCR